MRLLTRRFIGDYDGTLGKLITKLITRLNPRAGKIRRILCSDWLPERLRWDHLARSGFPAFWSLKKIKVLFLERNLLIKLDRSIWLGIHLILLCVVIVLDFVSVHKKNGQYPATLGQ